LSILLKYGKSYYLAFICAIGLLYAQATCDLTLPDLMSDIVNNGITTGNTSYIISVGLKMLGVSLLGVICSVLVGLISALVAAGMGRVLRRDVFATVTGFSNAEFDRFTTSSLITRNTNDITQIQMLVMMMIRMVIYAPILGVGGFLRALGKSQSMSWIIGLAVIMLIGVIVILFSLTMPRFKIIQKLIDRLNSVVRENLDGMLVIRAFNTQDFEEQRFDKANRDLTATNLFVNRAMVLMMPVMMLIMNMVTILVVWVGAHQISAFRMDVGGMMAYMQYAMQIIMSFLMMSVMFIMIPRAAVSVNRVAEVLTATSSIRESPRPHKAPKPVRGLVEFRDVSFRFPGAEENVLHHISFTAQPGQTTAFIGATGSGKSTVVTLLPRFYDVTEGQILIDGLDIRDWPLHDLRQNIGYVPQKSMLFSGAIGSNLAYGLPGASPEQLLRAADIAQAREFIESKPERLEEPIAQGGGNVSGGQRQRLSIARALVKNPPIYILDDSFSALDFKTDAALRAALKQNLGHSAILLVAQRISTIMGAEQIIVLDHGRVCGVGDHKYLMSHCQVYQEIALSQLSEEELQ
jgi:ATP-binding cassette subfamily B protein